jgi:hypothetical protein
MLTTHFRPASEVLCLIHSYEYINVIPNRSVTTLSLFAYNTALLARDQEFQQYATLLDQRHTWRVCSNPGEANPTVFLRCSHSRPSVYLNSTITLAGHGKCPGTPSVRELLSNEYIYSSALSLDTTATSHPSSKTPRIHESIRPACYGSEARAYTHRAPDP